MELAAPVLVGLAVGVVFVLIFGFFSPLIPFTTERGIFESNGQAENRAFLLVTKSDRPWASGDYITLSRAYLVEHSIMLHSIESAKVKYYTCAITNCFASPITPSYSFNTRLDEAEARSIVTKYPFKDISPPGNPEIRSYGLHIYYDGDYYGMAISVREAPKVWLERPLGCTGARCDVGWLRITNDSSSSTMPILVVTGIDGKLHVFAGNNFGSLDDTIQFMLNQHEKQGIKVFDYKLVPVRLSNCEWGECSDKYLLQILASEDDIGKINELGYALLAQSPKLS